MSDMTGKVVLITGATNGIGEEAALQLAKMGATVVVHGRSEARAKDSIARIQQAVPNAAVSYLLADLSVMAQVRDLAAQFKARFTRLDVLLNNAGAVFMSREVTADGYEMTFALNHLNYFLLTHLLLDLLKETAAQHGEARVVSVSSDAHQGAQNGLNFDDLHSTQRYSGFGAYAKSKLANILFSNELSRQLEGSGVTSNALHPGFVRTGFGKNNSLIVKAVMSVIQLGAITVEKGAQTSITLASAPELKGVSGGYYANSKPARLTAAAQDAAAARRLWEVSEQLTGVATPEVQTV